VSARGPAYVSARADTQVRPYIVNECCTCAGLCAARARS
jgi:hypothetical protein